MMDSRTVLWYVVLAAVACLGVALTTLAYVNTVNFPPSDATLTKNLAVYSDLVKAAPLGCPSDDVLCDYYMASSGYTVIPSTTVYTYITTDAITEVIKGGARLIELDIYSVNNDAVVGLADSKTNNMFTYNTLKFEDCCTTLANTMFASGTTPGYQNPFVLSLNFHSEDNAFITRCADIMKMTLRKFMLHSGYSYQRKNLAVEPICNLMGKLVIISGGNTKGNGMDELVNMSWASSNLRRMTYTEASQTFDHEELIEYNKRNITLVVPDMSSSDVKNKNAEICFSFGCQWVAMNYGSLDNAMELYTGQFISGSFAIKPDPLRYQPVTYKKPEPQSAAVSFQPKQITSPMYDFTIKSNQ
jgi:hypothetical protein